MELTAPQTAAEARVFAQGVVPPYKPSLRFDLTLLAGADVTIRPVPAPVPADRIKALALACSDDVLRPQLTGIYEDVTNETLVATNGRVLVVLPEPGLSRRQGASVVRTPGTWEVIRDVFNVEHGVEQPVTYPNWVSVVPADALRNAQYETWQTASLPKVGYSVYIEDIAAFAASIHGIKKIEAFRATKHTWLNVELVFPSTRQAPELAVWVRAPLLFLAVQALRADGARRLRITATTDNRAVVLVDADNAKRLALVMPLLKSVDLLQPIVRLAARVAAGPAAAAAPLPESPAAAAAPLPESPARLRARLVALAEVAAGLPAPARSGKFDKTRSDYELVRTYGFVAHSPTVAATLAYTINKRAPEQSAAPLTTAEWLTASTWFAAHPEKVAGPEVLAASSLFPVTIRATVDQVQAMLASAVARLTIARRQVDSAPAAAKSRRRRFLDLDAQALLVLQAQGLAGVGAAQLRLPLSLTAIDPMPPSTFAGFAGFAGLPGLSGLPGLGKLPTEQIAGAAPIVEAVLRQAQKKRPLGGTLSFEDVLKLYNSGISEDEMRAWVWYKRSLGHAMKGWEAYYLPGAPGGELAYAKRVTIIRDNHFRPLETVPAGTLLGRPTKFSLDYAGDGYRIVTLPTGAKAYVRADDLEVRRTTSAANPAEIDRLVRAGALFVSGEGEFLPLPAFTFGNMYDRELAFSKQQQEIGERYGADVAARHAAVIAEARPRQLSIIDPNPRARPVIAAISDFARHPELFSIQEVAAEYSDVDAATETAYVNGEKKERTKSRQKWNLNLDGNTRYNLISVFAKWLYTLTTRDFEKRTDAANIVQFYLEGGNIVNDELNPDEKRQLKYEAREEGERLFGRFLAEVLTQQDQQRLDMTWNRLYNGEAEVRADKVPVAFRCSDTFKMAALHITPAQRQGVAFFDLVGSGINAFDVGVGKTLCSIVALANGLSSGRMQRPLIVVPNAVYGKWIAEIFGATDAAGHVVKYGVLTGTGYKLNDWSNLGVDSVVAPAVAAREKGKTNTLLDKPVAAGTITIVTYEGFVKLGFSARVEGEMLSELAAVLQQSEDRESMNTLRAAAKAKPKKGSARDEEKKTQSLREMIGQALTNTVADYDTLGFDALLIDEAHNFNKVFESVPTDDEDNKRYHLQSRASARGVRAFLACNYIQRTNHGNVYLLTATPFTNSPLEVYSMLSLVAHAQMRRQGLQGLRHFCDAFIQPVAEYSVTPEGTLAVKEAVKSYVNRVVLQRLLHNHCLMKSGEEAGVPRPCKINLPRLAVRDAAGAVRRLPPSEQLTTYLAPSSLQAAGQAAIVAQIQNARDMMKARQMGLGKAEMFKALNHSLNNAITPFLYFGSAVFDELRGEKPVSMNVKLALTYTNQPLETVLAGCKGRSNEELLLKFSPKIAYAVEAIASVVEWHRADGSPLSGQLVYANRAKDFFPLIKQAIETRTGFRRGLPWEQRDPDGTLVGRYHLDEVELMTGDVPQLRRQRIKDAFNAGHVKVIIGTATIREGVDLQQKGTVIYNLAPDWNPTDVKQLEGRIWRQGNEYGYVRVVMPLVQDTMDVFVFQKLEDKSARINDLWSRAGRENVLDVESLDPQEIKLALLTDIGALAKMLLEGERLENERKLRAAREDVEVLKRVSALLDARNSRKKMIEDELSLLHNRGALADAQALVNQYAHAPTSEMAKKAHHLVDTLTSLLTWFDSGARELPPLLAHKKHLTNFYARFPSMRSPYVPAPNRWTPAPPVVNYSYEPLHSVSMLLPGLSDAFRRCAKAERSVLQPLGLTLADDLAPGTEQLNADVARLEALAATYYTEGGKRFDELKKEVEARKRTLAVVGRPPTERVEDFASLNYLLGFKYSRDVQGCALPQRPGGTRYHANASTEPATPAPAAAKSRRRRFLDLDAQALLVLQAQSAR